MAYGVSCDTSGTAPCAVRVPFARSSWTVQTEAAIPTTVQTTRTVPLSSPVTLAPKPKRLPSCGGLPVRPKPTPGSAVLTRCSVRGTGRAAPGPASTAAVPIAATAAARASFGPRLRYGVMGVLPGRVDGTDATQPAVCGRREGGRFPALPRG